MANQWVLYLGESPEKDSEWVECSDKGEILQGPQKGDLNQAAQAIAADPFVVVVPSRGITVLTEMVPARQREKVIKVIPYAMEEHVAEDVENLHFALGERTQDGSFLVAVVAHPQMEEWINQLNVAGLQPLLMVPDMLTLPYGQSFWTVAVKKEEGYCVVRTADSNAFSVDVPNLVSYLKLEVGALETTKRPERILLWGADSSLSLQVTSALAPIEIEELKEPEALCELLAKGTGLKLFVNLIQQQYEKKASLKEILGYLKPLAVVAGIWFLVMVGYKIFYYEQLASADETFYNQVVEIYRSTFPEDQKIVNPKAQMTSHLEKLRGGGKKAGFIPLLGLASSKLRNEPDVRLLGFRYGRSKGDLEVELETQDYQNFERVRQNLADVLDVEIRTSNISENNIVQGNLLLTRKKGTRK